MKYTLNPDYKDKVESFVKELPLFFEKEGTVLYDKRNIIKSYILNENYDVLNPVVVKRYKRPDLFQRIVYSFFRKTKAERAYHNASILRRRGFDTPCEIAYLEEWKLGLFNYGYFISSADVAPPIEERLGAEGEYDRRMAECFGSFVADLHGKGILHHDLNCTNVLYHPTADGYSFSLIDINRMKVYPAGKCPTHEECYENLTRFTGRMDIYEHVLRSYIQKRGWEMQTALYEGICVKRRHDKRWEQKKAFLHALFPKKR